MSKHFGLFDEKTKLWGNHQWGRVSHLPKLLYSPRMQNYPSSKGENTLNVLQHAQRIWEVTCVKSTDGYVSFPTLKMTRTGIQSPGGICAERQSMMECAGFSRWSHQNAPWQQSEEPEERSKQLKSGSQTEPVTSEPIKYTDSLDSSLRGSESSGAGQVLEVCKKFSKQLWWSVNFGNNCGFFSAWNYLSSETE